MLNLQPRDIEILGEIAASPACSRQHVARAFFSGSYDAAKKRLQQLALAGLIENNDASSTGRSILRIRSEGRRLIGSSTPQDSISRRLHAHEKMLADVRAAFKATANSASHEVEFSTDPEQIGFSVSCNRHVEIESIRPDGFLTLDSGKDALQYFFLEIDRSTETQGHLAHLATQYREFQKSGNFSKRFGNLLFVRVGFRVLLVVPSRERLLQTGRNLRKSASIGTLIWLATINDVLENPFGSIWLCPLDFDNSPVPSAFRSLF